ncbi:hypothetical protein TNCV_568761 [Trichonephila clavipes]|nr:hypothetical protein TNCV_568761 [Trichonephila clavipes]
MFESSSYVNPTPLAHADTSRDVLPRGAAQCKGPYFGKAYIYAGGSERIGRRYTLEIMDEILTTARDLELEMNEDDIEELIMGHEDELTTEELQEILNKEHQETQ